MNRSDGKPKVYNKSHKTKWKIGMTLMIDPYRVKEMVQDGKAHYHAMAMQGAYLIIGEN